MNENRDFVAIPAEIRGIHIMPLGNCPVWPGNSCSKHDEETCCGGYYGTETRNGQLVVLCVERVHDVNN